MANNENTVRTPAVLQPMAPMPLDVRHPGPAPPEAVGHLGTLPVTPVPNSTADAEVITETGHTILTNQASASTVLTDHTAGSSVPHLNEKQSVETVAIQTPILLPALPDPIHLLPTSASQKVTEASKPISKDDLLHAIKKGDAKEVERMLSTGADLAQMKAEDMDALREALDLPESKEKEAIVKLTAKYLGNDASKMLVDGQPLGFDYKMNITYMTYAVLKGSSPETLKTLMSNGAKIHDAEATPYDALVPYAASKGIDLIGLFIESGAANKFPEIKNKLLLDCASHGLDSSVQKLLRAGADFNYKEHGLNAAQIACQQGNLNVVKQLALHGQKLDEVKDNKGNTLLHMTCSNLNENTIGLLDYLVSSGLDINAVNNKEDNLTPLATAISDSKFSNYYLFAKIIKNLIGKNAEIQATNHHNFAVKYMTVVNILETDSVNPAEVNKEIEEIIKEIPETALKLEIQYAKSTNNEPLKTLLTELTSVQDPQKKEFLIASYFEMRGFHGRSRRF